MNHSIVFALIIIHGEWNNMYAYIIEKHSETLIETWRALGGYFTCASIIINMILDNPQRIIVIIDY